MRAAPARERDIEESRRGPPEMAGSWTVPALLIVFSYVLGTFPSAILVAKANGVDISTFGSGNPGASNVTRALGWRKGVWVYVLDALAGLFELADDANTSLCGPPSRLGVDP